MKRKNILLLAAVLMAAPLCAQAQTAPDHETIKVDITRGCIDALTGIAYSQITTLKDNRILKMSLLVPRTDKPKPAIVYFPGGGFTTAAHDKFIEMRMALAEAGFVVAAVEYRTVPDKFPALLVDGKSAVRYLRAHARQLGIDPDRIGVLGDSAGGYLAQMVGVTGDEKEYDQGDNLDQSSAVQAVATLYGISNLMNIGEGYPKEIQDIHASDAVTEALLIHGTAFASHPGASILSDTTKAMAASSMGHIREGLPPFLVMHGTADTLVSPVQSAQLYKALKSAHDDVQYVEVEGAGHGDMYWFQQPIIDRVVKWFKDKLAK